MEGKRSNSSRSSIEDAILRLQKLQLDGNTTDVIVGIFVPYNSPEEQHHESSFVRSMHQSPFFSGAAFLTEAQRRLPNRDVLKSNKDLPRCGAKTTRGTACANAATSCPHHK